MSTTEDEYVPPFEKLDADCIRAVATALPRCAPANVMCLDRRSPSLSSFSRTSKAVRAALLDPLAAMRTEHEVRRAGLQALCSRLFISWESLQRAVELSSSPGHGVCTSCGRSCPKFCGLFGLARRAEAEQAELGASVSTPAGTEAAEATFQEQQADSAMQTDEDDFCVVPGEPHCGHCWRAAHSRPMRFGLESGELPGGEEVQQDSWESAEREGSWQLVPDFSTQPLLDSPLVARHEYAPLNGWETLHEGIVSDSWTSHWELVKGLRSSGYLLYGMGEWAAPRPSRLAFPRDSFLIADLLSSGYGSHLLSIDLSGCGLTDAALGALATALVGNCLLVQYLSVADNPISDDGVCALTGVLSPRCYEMVLPSLRWLNIWSDDLHNRGAIAIADALRAGALPSLELIWCCGAFTPGQGAGFNALTRACDARGLTLELEHGIVWGS